MKALHLKVSGRVQGVAYRVSTQKVAQELGLVGWVKNLPDGRVEIWAEGPETALKQLRAWSQTGPRLARVDQIEEQETKARHQYHSFDITH